ncbi:MAG: hypothetical protein K0R39_1114 [Symbiobacteriaceae bacterium]|jgi:Holliday junction resolvase-like predicted endonuclease|nr:hypothetical protein [Symbiobacteriaceae bacterium]
MEMGESLVAAYFKYVEGIRMVVHNAQFDQGQGEMDLIVIDPKQHRVFFCEVTTHIVGMLYGSGNDETVAKVRDKLARAREFAATQFEGWAYELQVWAPVVSKGLAGKLLDLEMELNGQGMKATMVINKRYAERVDQLQAVAKVNSSATDEPAFRMLQILARLRRE